MLLTSVSPAAAQTITVEVGGTSYVVTSRYINYTPLLTILGTLMRPTSGNHTMLGLDLTTASDHALTDTIEFYMGRNTQERRSYIMDHLVITEESLS